MYESYNVGFQHEWCEVAISCHDNDTGNTDIPEFPQREQQVVDQSAPQTEGSKTEHGHSWGGGEHSQLTGEGVTVRVGKKCTCFRINQIVSIKSFYFIKSDFFN